MLPLAIGSDKGRAETGRDWVRSKPALASWAVVTGPDCTGRTQGPSGTRTQSPKSLLPPRSGILAPTTFARGVRDGARSEGTRKPKVVQGVSVSGAR